jgi:hypothetical protein
MFNARALPKGAMPETTKGVSVKGIHGTGVLNQEVVLTELVFPEFSPTLKVVGPVRTTVFHNKETNYDLIVGMDVMIALGIEVSCSTQTIKWNDNVIPFQSVENFKHMGEHIALAMEALDDPLDEEMGEEYGYKSKKILHSKYEQVEVLELSKQQTHLTPEQQADLARLWSKFTKLFSGQLGAYPHQKVHLDLKDDAKRQSSRYYPIPRHHERVFKDELQRLCEIGVLTKCGPSEWLAPS